MADQSVEPRSPPPPPLATAITSKPGTPTSRIPLYKPHHQTGAARVAETEPEGALAVPSEDAGLDAVTISRQKSKRDIIKKDRTALRDDIIVKMAALEQIQFDEESAIPDGHFSSSGVATEEDAHADSLSFSPRIGRNPLSATSLSASVVAPSGGFIDLGIASVRKPGPAFGETTGAYAMAHWRHGVPSDLRRRADALLNASTMPREYIASLPELSLSRQMAMTAAMWEFHLSRTGQRQGAVGGPSVLAGTASFRGSTTPVSSTTTPSISSDRYVDFVGGVFEYFASSYDASSANMFHAYLRNLAQPANAYTGYGWLMRHMLGLSGIPGAFNPLFAEAALAVMRAVRRLVPERKASFMQAMFARGPTAGSSIGTVRGSPSSPGTSGAGSSFSFHNTGAVCSGYEPATVSVMSAIRIVEQVMAYSPAFAMAPLQRFCDTFGLRRMGWTAAGKRDITEMLLACILGRFDMDMLLCSDSRAELLYGPAPPSVDVDILKEEGDDADEDGVDSSVHFPTFFAKQIESSSASTRGGLEQVHQSLSEDALDVQVLPFSTVIRQHADAVGEALMKQQGPAVMNVEELIVGLMAAWLREYERWGRRLDRAYYLRLKLDRNQHEKAIHQMFEAHMAPVFEDLESMLGTIDPEEIAEEDVADAAKEAALAVIDEAIADAKAVCVHQPTVAVLLVSELRKTVVQAVGTMARVNFAAMQSLAQARKEHEVAVANSEAAAAIMRTSADVKAKHTAELDAANMRCAEALKQAAAAKQQLDAAVAKVTVLEGQLQEALVSATAANKRAEEGHAQVATLHSELAHLQSKYAALQAENAASRTQAANAQAGSAELKARVAELESALVAEKAEVAAAAERAKAATLAAPVQAASPVNPTSTGVEPPRAHVPQHADPSAGSAQMARRQDKCCTIM